MIAILSPSKTLRDTSIPKEDKTLPLFPEETAQLMTKLKSLSKPKIKKLMSISDNLTKLNYQRYKDFDTKFETKNGEPAIYSFLGDVFQGLEAEDFSKTDLDFAESHLYILSGLYGLLKPSTVIQPYRLEMGTKLKSGRKNNLYEFWNEKLTKEINESLANHKDKTLVNLASNEYSKAIHFNNIDGNVLEINFKEWRDEQWKFISFNAKKARGMMAKYMIKNQLTERQDLKGFDYDGYAFNEDLSSAWEWYFTR